MWSVSIAGLCNTDKIWSVVILGPEIFGLWWLLGLFHLVCGTKVKKIGLWCFSLVDEWPNVKEIRYKLLLNKI